MKTQVEGQSEPNQQPADASIAQKVAALGRILKAILAPSTDRLLPGYSELIETVKDHTAAEQEKRDARQEQALKAAAQEQRKHALRKDADVLDFLGAHKTDIMAIIEASLAERLVVFPTDPSLASKLTAEEKVRKVELGLRNPQLIGLSRLLYKAVDTSACEFVSPQTRRKLQAERARQEREELQTVLLYEQMRDVDMADLGQLLEDIESIEADSRRVELADGNKLSLGEQKRASLGVILPISQEKVDKAKEEQEVQRRRSELSARAGSPSMHAINRFLGHPEQRRSEVASLASTWLAPTPGVEGYDAGVNSMCHGRDSDALFGYENVRQRPNEQNMFVRDVRQPQARQHSTKHPYPNLAAIQASANAMFKFNHDIDNDDEDELSDGSLKDRIKQRKIDQRNLRAELTVVNKACIDTMKNVERERKKIVVDSLIDRSLDLPALRAKQAALKQKIDESNMEINDQQMPPRHRGPAGQVSALNQNSGDLANSSAISFGLDHHGTPIDPTLLVAHPQPLREPTAVEEEEYQDSEAPSSGAESPSPLARMQDNMRQFSIHPDSMLGQEEMVMRNRFKASFISHICTVSAQKEKYRGRLQEFNLAKSVKAGLIDQGASERQIYESVHHRRTSRSIPRNESSRLELLKLQSGTKLATVRGTDLGGPDSTPLLPLASTSHMPSAGAPSEARDVPTPGSVAVNPKTIKQTDSLLIHVDQQMRGMMEAGTMHNILGAMQAEHRSPPQPGLLLQIVKSGGGRADRPKVSKSPSSPGHPSPIGSALDLNRDPSPITHHYIRMPLPGDAGSARSLLNAQSSFGKKDEDPAATLVNPNLLLGDGALESFGAAQAHQVERQQVIQEQTASGESSVAGLHALAQEGPTPRETPQDPQASPAQLSFSQDGAQGEPTYLGLPFQALVTLAPPAAGGSQAPVTTYHLLPQAHEDSRQALLPATQEDQRHGSGAAPRVPGESAMESAMMDQGEQVDFLTELHPQPPVTVSVQDSHGQQPAGALSPGAGEHEQPGDQPLGTTEQGRISVMAEVQTSHSPLESEMLGRHASISPGERSSGSKHRTVFAKMFKIPLPPDIDGDEQPDLGDALPERQRTHLQRRFGGPGNAPFGPPLPSSTFYQVRLEAVQPSQASRLTELRNASLPGTQGAQGKSRGRALERRVFPPQGARPAKSKQPDTSRGERGQASPGSKKGGQELPVGQLCLSSGEATPDDLDVAYFGAALDKSAGRNVLSLKIPNRKMSPKYTLKHRKKEGKPTLLLQVSPQLSPEGTAYGERRRQEAGEPGTQEPQQRLSSNTIPILGQGSRAQLLPAPENVKSTTEIAPQPEAAPRMQARIDVREMKHAHELSGKDFATENMASEYEAYSTARTPLNLAGKQQQDRRGGAGHQTNFSFVSPQPSPSALDPAGHAHKRSQGELPPSKRAIHPRLQSTTLKIALQKEKTKRLARIINARLDELSTNSLTKEYHALQKNEQLQPSAKFLHGVRRQVEDGLVSPDTETSFDPGRQQALGKIISSLQITGEQFQRSGDWNINSELPSGEHTAGPSRGPGVEAALLPADPSREHTEVQVTRGQSREDQIGMTDEKRRFDSLGNELGYVSEGGNEDSLAPDSPIQRVGSLLENPLLMDGVEELERFIQYTENASKPPGPTSHAASGMHVSHRGVDATERGTLAGGRPGHYAESTISVAMKATGKDRPRRRSQSPANHGSYGILSGQQDVAKNAGPQIGQDSRATGNRLPPLAESSTIALITEEDSARRLHQEEHAPFPQSRLPAPKGSAVHSSVHVEHGPKGAAVEYCQPTPRSVLKVHAMPSERHQSLAVRGSERSGSRATLGARDSLVAGRWNRKGKLPALNATQVGLGPAAGPKKSFRLSEGRTVSIDKRIANNFQVTIKQNQTQVMAGKQKFYDSQDSGGAGGGAIIKSHKGVIGLGAAQAAGGANADMPYLGSLLDGLQSTRQSLAYQSINEQSMIDLIENKPLPLRQAGKRTLNALHNSVLLPNTTRNLPLERQRPLFQSLRAAPRHRSPAPQAAGGAVWSKNGRPVKAKGHPIQSGSVVLVDKQADKLLNQQQVRNLEHLLGLPDMSAPVASTRTQEGEIQRVVIDTINQKVPADLKHIQDQGSQEIAPIGESATLEPPAAPATPSGPSRSHLQLHIAKAGHAAVQASEPDIPTFKFTCSIHNPEPGMAPHPIAHQGPQTLGGPPQNTNASFYSQGTSVAASALGRSAISIEGQRAIANSIWVDDASFTNKRSPSLLLKDLKAGTKNGKVEMGKSPFNRDDFVRVDGTQATLQLALPHQRISAAALAKI